MEQNIIYLAPFFIFFLSFGLMLFYYYKDQAIYQKLLPYLVLICLVAFFYLYAAQLYFLRQNLLESEFGQFFLQGENNLFKTQTIETVKTIGFNLAVGIVSYLVVFVAVKKQKRLILENSAPQVFALSALVLGGVNYLVFLALTFALALLYLLGKILIKRQNSYVQIIPFMLISALVIQLASFSPYYYQFLTILKLG